MLYAALKADYPDVSSTSLPKLPKEIRDQDPILRYQPTLTLCGAANSIQVGDRVFSLSTLAYPGWTNFKALIESLIRATKDTGLVKEVERFSFRYINLIECEPSEKQLTLLNARIDFAGDSVLERGMQIRFERDEFGFTTVIPITPQTSAKLPQNKTVTGLLIDVDTLRQNPKNYMMIRNALLLDEGHSILKRTFFSLLTDATMDRLGEKEDDHIGHACDRIRGEKDLGIGCLSDHIFRDAFAISTISNEEPEYFSRTIRERLHAWNSDTPSLIRGHRG
jgi:uncharacterized protein (TIGR04255 family)